MYIHGGSRSGMSHGMLFHTIGIGYVCRVCVCVCVGMGGYVCMSACVCVCVCVY